jgi:hypothetical protein
MGSSGATPSNERSSSGVSPILGRIEMNTARCRATYAEVQESEADLERIERLTAISDPDYFETAGDAAARSAAQGCRESLAAFETGQGAYARIGFCRFPPCVCGRDVIEVTHGLAAAACEGLLKLSEPRFQLLRGAAQLAATNSKLRIICDQP